MQQLKWLSLTAAFILPAFAALVRADPAADVAALEAQCEQQREELIKPLRDMEIAKCKAEKQNDAGYCERYWKDYGNPVRTGNGMTPRMFNDLPVCLAAFKARKDLINRDHDHD